MTAEHAITPPTVRDGQESFLQHYQRSSNTRMSDGSYSTKFPWKEDSPTLPSNYSNCAWRTRAMVRHLAQTPSLLKLYGEIIKEHKKRGFIKRVENVDSLDRAHYLPHYAVKSRISYHTYQSSIWLQLPILKQLPKFERLSYGGSSISKRYVLHCHKILILHLQPVHRYRKGLSPCQLWWKWQT